MVGQHELADALVQDRINIGLLHQVVTAELAGHRQGTASAKTQGEVAGTAPSSGGRRAPAGPAWGSACRSCAAEAWRSAHPRSYAMKVNQKVNRKAHSHGLVAAREPRARSASSRLLRRAIPDQGGPDLVGKAERQDCPLSSWSARGARPSKSFRNLPGRRADASARLEVATTSGPRACCSPRTRRSFERSLGDRAERAVRSPDGRARDPRCASHPSPHLREELRADRQQPVLVRSELPGHQAPHPAAVEEIFKVKVIGVNIINMKPKPKRRGAHAAVAKRLEEGRGRLAPGQPDRVLRRDWQ